MESNRFNPEFLPVNPASVPILTRHSFLAAPYFYSQSIATWLFPFDLITLVNSRFLMLSSELSFKDIFFFLF